MLYTHYSYILYSYDVYMLCACIIHTLYIPNKYTSHIHIHNKGQTGSPEKPLSDLGKISYRSYWAYILLTYIQTNTNNKHMLTIQEIAKSTGIRTEDILSTLHTLNLIKLWKGQHVICISTNIISSYLAQTKEIKLCDPAYLNWTPPAKSS